MTPPAPRDPVRETILVVDDTPESLRFLTDMLDSAGMTVLIATTGEAAIDLLDHIMPDLILMDAVMPGIGGFETTRRIKRHSHWAHIPVIFMTGLTDSEHVVHALDAGGVDYVRKPIIVEELLARVRVHLANARITQGSQAALDATGRHLMSVDADGRLLWLTPQAESLLRTMAPEWTRDADALPVLLHTPVQRLLADGDRPGHAVRIDMPQTGSTLELVVVTRYRDAETLVRLNDINPEADVARLQSVHALTQREAEVLLWISYGKPNRVISEILSISPRTVNKHLEQIFEKLGVETRSAAAAFAVRTISQ
ncbi:DNA-binding response regulator [Sphingobium algorifonticola]|uniref:Response regulator transcription factor n=1 Tax=Sphingobium algorifonticola TaxID=2008318 RepID=A0A437J6E1_9SPHN|nr:DNA-binding response regulator [Sphingobium algorifonticola]RVT40741.1 response regulator transcription factor [Sphingobium algorifonticola]